MSVFSDEWRICLREQYKYVIRNNDTVTLPSLTNVMHQVGFTDDELAQLRMEITMRTEDVPEDFVLDLNILRTESKEFQPHPLECQCPSCMTQSLTPHDDEGQPIALEDLDVEEYGDDPDAPQQLTMF